MGDSRWLSIGRDSEVLVKASRACKEDERDAGRSDIAYAGPGFAMAVGGRRLVLDCCSIGSAVKMVTR